jgi:hypothetical protein
MTSLHCGPTGEHIALDAEKRCLPDSGGGSVALGPGAAAGACARIPWIALGVADGVPVPEVSGVLALPQEGGHPAHRGVDVAEEVLVALTQEVQSWFAVKG